MLYNRNVSVKHHTDEKEELFLAVSFLYVIPFRLAIVAKHLHYTMYSTSHSVFNGNGNVISFLSIMKIDFKKKYFTVHSEGRIRVKHFQYGIAFIDTYLYHHLGN